MNIERPDQGLPNELFARVDEGDDANFYQLPRLVAHIDPGTIAALTQYYRDVLPTGARVLDLMSSWISHLPKEARYATVAGSRHERGGTRRESASRCSSGAGSQPQSEVYRSMTVPSTRC